MGFTFYFAVILGSVIFDRLFLTFQIVNHFDLFCAFFPLSLGNVGGCVWRILFFKPGHERLVLRFVTARWLGKCFAQTHVSSGSIIFKPFALQLLEHRPRSELVTEERGHVLSDCHRVEAIERCI